MLKSIIVSVCLFILSCASLKGQIGYILIESGGEFLLHSIDLSTCEICQIANGIPFSSGIDAAEITMLPNGNWLVVGSCSLNLMSTPPNSAIVYTSATDPCYTASAYNEINDIIYIMGIDGLYTFDPVAFTFTFIGPWPASWNVISYETIHFTDGILYGTAFFEPDPNYQLFQIDINNPSNSSILFSIPFIVGSSGSQSGYYFIEQGSLNIGEYDITTQSSSIICNYLGFGFYANIDVPTFTLPDYDCIITCDTDAGQVTNLDPILACVSQPVSINPAIDTELEADDVLQYIIFTDLNDTLGTIIATSNTPDFIFDSATMIIGVTYYITSIAADDDGTGNTDFTDPCFDIGTNAQAIEWVAEPTVTFSVANNEICENGCKEITATFTGIPPFTLSYQVGNGAEVTEVFNTTNGNFEICIGSETGSIDLMATNLSDAVCCGV
ncbi:MAG: hypothetical protein P1U56_16965 [Saprospiraceae bacterium]|nr:hypothetical protein [Saprospiraceae bacterium]